MLTSVVAYESASEYQWNIPDLDVKAEGLVVNQVITIGSHMLVEFEGDHLITHDEAVTPMWPEECLVAILPGDSLDTIRQAYEVLMIEHYLDYIEEGKTFNDKNVLSDANLAVLLFKRVSFLHDLARTLRVNLLQLRHILATLRLAQTYDERLEAIQRAKNPEVKAFEGAGR